MVEHLGEAEESERNGIASLATGTAAPQCGLFEDHPPQWLEVDSRRVRVERARRFGDVWLALELMRKLRLPELLADVLPSPRAKIPWADLAMILVVARFYGVESELSIAERFYASTALSDLLGIATADVYENRLYRALDVLVAHKDVVQQRIKERFGDLFAIGYDVLLYDVTSTYFEGAAMANPDARRGYSRDGRSDCKQVTVGLVVTREGIPLGYEMFEGNRHDSKTVDEIVRKLETLYGTSNRIWVMDRGMVSAANHALLPSGRRDIIGTPKSMLRKFEHQMLDQQWEQVHAGLEVKRCASPVDSVLAGWPRRR